MKYIKFLIALLMFVFIIAVPFSVSAIDTGLITQSLSDEEASDIVKQREFVKITSYTPLTAKCFDVSDDHMVVIGADAGDIAIIAVYNDSGIFQYGFKTKEYGSFRVMWSGNDIAYYSIRSALIFEINEDGKITEICRVANTMENSIYDRDILLSTTRKVGTATYSMTNERSVADALSSSFKKIIKTDAEGSRVIYDASGNQSARVVGGIVIFLILSSVIVSSIVVGIKKHCKRETITHNTGQNTKGRFSCVDD